MKLVIAGDHKGLRAAEALSLIRAMRAACRGVLLLDTFVAVRPTAETTIDGETWRGALHREHSEDATPEERERDLWASIDNETSFWFTEAALIEAVHRAGFSSFCQVLPPTHPGVSFDRRTSLGFAGAPAPIRSSEPTDALAHAPAREFDPENVHPSQVRRSLVERHARRLLPKPVKAALRPLLRAIGVLKDRRPAFLRR